MDSLSKVELLKRLETCLISNQPHHVVTLNSLMILESEKVPLLKKICEEASLVVPESSGISWAALYLGHPKVERIPGIDLAFELCGLARNLSLPIFLLGGAKGVAEEAGNALGHIYPGLKVGGARDGFFNEAETPAIIHEIEQSRARLILVALGMPKQELWIYEHKPNLPGGLYIGVGGSFDVWSGRIKRAPSWLRTLGLEWLYRLKAEPFRWRRIAQLPKFALKIASKSHSSH